MTIRLGTRIPTRTAEDAASFAQRCREAEQAGFDTLWFSDHVVMTDPIRSPYPFAPDGIPNWDPRDAWFDAITLMSVAATVTEACEVGTSVLVLPQRNPVVLAKQAASLDVLSGGRVTLGVGVGWLREEYEALATPWAGRGKRMDEWMALLRELWSGEPSGIEGEHYVLSDDVVSYPVPHTPIPLLVGGMSPAALRRAGRLGDGWIALVPASDLEPGTIASGVDAMTDAAREAGRDVESWRVVLRSGGDLSEVRNALPTLDAEGVTDLNVDVDWHGDGPRAVVEALRR